MKDRQPATPRQMYFDTYDVDGGIYTGSLVIAPPEEPEPRPMSKVARIIANPILPHDLLSRRFQLTQEPVAQIPDIPRIVEDIQQ